MAETGKIREFKGRSSVQKAFVVGVDPAELEAPLDQMTASVNVAAPPPQVFSPPEIAVRHLWDHVRFVFDTIARSVIHAVYYVVLFGFVCTFAGFVYWLGSGSPATPKFPIILLICLLITITFLNIYDVQWKLYRAVPIQSWIINWRKSLLPFNPGTANNTIFIGGMQVHYAFNEKVFSIMTPGEKLVMAIDISLLREAVVPKKPPKYWRSVKQKCPPVIVEMVGDAELWIHGGYFEKKGSGQDFAQEFADSLNAIIKTRNTKQI